MKKQLTEWIGDYRIEVGQQKLEVGLYHKDGRVWSDPARAMSHLLKELQERDQQHTKSK